MMTFREAQIKHLLYTFSDHCSILIDMGDCAQIRWPSKFRFESWWLMEDTLESVVRELWLSYSGALLDKLSGLQVGLIDCAKSIKRKRGALKNSYPKA